MALTSNLSSFLCAFLLISIPSVFSTNSGGSATIGINYGRLANNLPPPPQVVQLIKAQGLTRVKIFDTDSAVLSAFAGSGISVTVCLPNEQLSAAAANTSFTDTWVQSNILPHQSNTTVIDAIAVGNEVLKDSKNTPFLVPAMKNIYTSLAKYNLSSSVHVSSPLSYDALQTSYPPSSGAFKPDLIGPVIKPMLDFLNQTGSFLMVNIYPFFAYSSNPNSISLDYALFRNNSGHIDSNTGLAYRSLFEAQIDAVFAAMAVLGYNKVKVEVTETGWPSKGDANEVGASMDNAAAYNGNLARRVLTGGGTPLRPDESLTVYLFALFNENLKPGATSERNYGLFYPNQQKVYDVPLTQDSLKNQKLVTVIGQLDSLKSQKFVAVIRQSDDEDGDNGGSGGAQSPPSPGGQSGGSPPGGSGGGQSGGQSPPSGGGSGGGGSPPSGGGGGDQSGGGSPPSGGGGGDQSGGGSPPSGGGGGGGGGGGQYCVANEGAGNGKIQEALDWACGPGGVDCAAVNSAGKCYEPNTLAAHASYAFNSYYQQHGKTADACDFKGAGKVSSQQPQCSS